MPFSMDYPEQMYYLLSQMGIQLYQISRDCKFVIEVTVIFLIPRGFNLI